MHSSYKLQISCLLKQVLIISSLIPGEHKNGTIEDTELLLVREFEINHVQHEE